MEVTGSQNGFLNLDLALLNRSLFDFTGSKAKGETSEICSLYKVDLELIALLNQDNLKDFQKLFMLGNRSPPCFLAICLVVLSTMFGLLSEINILSSDSSSFRYARLRLGTTENM